MPEPHEPPDLAEIEIGTVFSALASPLRRRIVADLLTRPGMRADRCSEFDVGVGKSTLTHHIRVMSQAGLITETDHGNRCAIRLRAAELEDRFPGLLDLIRADATISAPAR
jgi:DNA-binding transcriptional ArsR family regulator